MRVLFAVALMCLVASPAFAGKKFYKWQDENGVWHYTEKQPKDQAAAPVNVSAKAPDVGDTAADASGKKADVPAGMADDPAAQRIVAGRQAACERAQQAVKVYEENAEVTLDLDKDGKAEVLTTQQHLEQLAKAREQASSYCN